jgi:hypothetical protein
MNTADTGLWPRVSVVLVFNDPGMATTVARSLQLYGFELKIFRKENLLIDLTYHQAHILSVDAAVSQLQHRINLHCSPFAYAMGVSSHPLFAWHAACTVAAGCSQWCAPWALPELFSKMPVERLSILDDRLPGFFLSCGYSQCGELRDLKQSVLVHRVGRAGKQLWLLGRGKVFELPEQEMLTADAVSWELPLPARTRSHRALSAHAWSLYQLARHSLRHQLHRHAGRLELKLVQRQQSQTRTRALTLETRLHNRRELTTQIFPQASEQGEVTHLRLTATRLQHPAGQLDLFPQL